MYKAQETCVYGFQVKTQHDILDCEKVLKQLNYQPRSQALGVFIDLANEWVSWPLLDWASQRSASLPPTHLYIRQAVMDGWCQQRLRSRPFSPGYQVINNSLRSNEHRCTKLWAVIIKWQINLLLHCTRKIMVVSHERCGFPPTPKSFIRLRSMCFLSSKIKWLIKKEMNYVG